MKQEFIDYLKSTSLEEIDKKYLEKIFDFFKGSHPKEFVNRIYLLEGEPGSGKTFLSKKLIKSLGKEVIYVGQSEFKETKNKRVKDVKELLKFLDSFSEGVVFLDDLDKILDRRSMAYDDGGGLTSHFNNLLDNFDSGAIMIFSVNDSRRLGNALKDRAKVIRFDLPGKDERAEFYQKMMDTTKIKFDLKKEDLVKASENFNYRTIQRLWNELILYSLENNLKEINNEHLKIVGTVVEPLRVSRMVG